MERRNDVLARLYVVRTDVQYTVRQEALHVWKTVVVNTPKTLGQILPDLMSIVIESLADEGEDRRQVRTPRHVAVTRPASIHADTWPPGQPPGSLSAYPHGTSPRQCPYVLAACAR